MTQFPFSQPMNVAQWIIFAIQLLIEYGPALVKWGRSTYEYIEELRRPKPGTAEARKPAAEQIPLDSAQKRTKFALLVAPEWVSRKGAAPTREAMDLFREAIWRRANGRHAIPVDKVWKNGQFVSVVHEGGDTVA